MPKHQELSPDEPRVKKHKKAKRKNLFNEEDAICYQTIDRQQVSQDVGLDRFLSKHKHHKKDYKSPEQLRVKEIKKEKSTKEFDHHFNDQHRRHHRRDVRIKKEEDFDRRQEELRERRREGRSQRDDRPNSFRTNREHEDREGHSSRSQQNNRDERRRYDDDRRRERRRRDRDGTTEEAFKDDGEKEEKEKPNLGLSGALTEDTNTFRGVVIKYNEPPEARKPKKRWRLYPFKGTESLKTLYLHRQSAFLLGRQRRIADIPIDHPSCSKQHAVLQFRMVEVEVDGELRRRVKPYVLDLGSANGTYLNNERIDPQRYVELKERDVLKFGFSSREYVLLHDKSDTGDVELQSESEEEEFSEDRHSPPEKKD